MKIDSSNLETIAVRASQYPTDNRYEFLLCGRSNVGKSSFINSILGRKNYAHTSSKPGKTQTLNFYLINEAFYIVDVPGYGYADVSKEKQMKFGLMIEEYIKERKNLKAVFLLIDFKVGVTEDDILMYNFLKYYDIPVMIVATKCDKIKPSLKAKQVDTIMADLKLQPNDDIIEFSSVTKKGRDEILELISEYLED